MQNAPRLSRFGGEFAMRALERRFVIARFGETRRHARILLIASAVLNTLFFISDWRFFGTAHFPVAIGARSLVVLIALLGLASLRACRTPGALQAVLMIWITINALGVGALVTSHSDIALFVVMILPIIYYLVVPLGFRLRLAAGAGCSVLMLVGYGWDAGSPLADVGLALTVLMLNVALAIVVARSNRLERLAWSAMRAAQRMAGELVASQDVMERMFAASPIPLVVTAREDGRILQANDRAVNLLGIDRASIGVETLHRYYGDPSLRGQIVDMLDRHGSLGEMEAQARHADGSTRTVLVKASLFDTPQGRVVVTGFIDISDRKAAERSLEWLAATDALTGLPNRLSFFATARVAMTAAARSDEPLSLLMIDLDHFKTINDTYGHQAGDQVLRAFSDLCVARLDGQDIIGRLGGEEFGVLLPGADTKQAWAKAEMLRRALEDMRLPRIDAALCVSASFGISAVLAPERDLDAAISRADAALYVAKRAGRNRVLIDPSVKVHHPRGSQARGAA